MLKFKQLKNEEMPQVQKSAIVESKSEMPDHNSSISKLEIEMPPHVKKPAELGFIQKIEPIQEESDQLSNINMDESTKKLVRNDKVNKDFSLNISYP